MSITMIKVFLSATILFLAIVGIRKLFREKVGNGFIYSLWLIFAMDLFVSGVYLAGQDAFDWNLYPIQSSFSVMNLVDIFSQESQREVSSFQNGESAVNQTEYMGEKNNKNSGENSTKGIGDVSGKKESTSGQREETLTAGMMQHPDGVSMKWDWRKILFGIWIAGAVFLFILQILFERRFRRQLVENRQETDYQGQKLYVTKGITTPLLFRSRGISLDIYIPEMIMNDENVVKHAILHENTHKKHGDIWWSYVRNVLVALYWFYPPVWIAVVMSKRDCELACDSSLMRDMNQREKISYGNSLLSLVEVGKKENVFSTATAMKIGKSEMEVRIKMIKNGIHKKKLIILLVCVLLCGAGIVAYTDTGNTGKQEENKTAVTPVPSDEDEQGNNVPVREAEYKITDLWGADEPRIRYEDDSCMIFAGYFGLFVYSKPEGKIVQSLDLKYIGCNYTQGDNYCDIEVSQDGTQVYLHISNDETMYQYSVDTNQLHHVKYALPENLYTRPEEDEPNQSNIDLGGATIGDLAYRYADANGEYFHSVPLFYAPYAPYASCEFFAPEDIHDICEVSFYLCGKEYVIKDAEKLKWIEEHLSNPVEEIKGGASCPFNNVMYLEREDGTIGKMYPAMDSCAIYGTWGTESDEYAYYEYDEGKNDTFWKLFGIEDIAKASVWEEIGDAALSEEWEKESQLQRERVLKMMAEAEEELGNIEEYDVEDVQDVEE